MKTVKIKSLVLFTSLLLVFASNNSFGQTGIDSLVNNDMKFEQKKDTLYSNTGLKLFVGQQLIIGKPSGADGHFRSIISKKAAIVPSIWGQDKRYENAIENYVDSKKNRENLKTLLLATTTLTIKGIGLSKIGKPYFYLLSLSSDTVECKADIMLALKLNELLLVK